jgi:hypothetical protein
MNLLHNLRIEECSVVDSPANDLPGWLLMKSKDEGGKLRREFLKLMDELAARTDLSDAEKISRAAKALRLIPADLREEYENAAIAQRAVVEKSGDLKQLAEKPHPSGLWTHSGASLFR